MARKFDKHGRKMIAGVMLLAGLGLCAAAALQQPSAAVAPDNSPAPRFTASYASNPYAEERVINLPEDGGQCWLTVVKVSGDADLSGWFDSDPRLAALKKQCKFNVYDTADPMFRDDVRLWFGDVGHFGVALQTGQLSDGKSYAIYKARDGHMPTSPEQLADTIAAYVHDFRAARHLGNGVDSEVKGRIFGWRNCNNYCYPNNNCYPNNCPDCRPKPKPDPRPDNTPVNPPNNVLPDMGPDAAGVDDELPLSLAVGLGLALGAAAMFVYVVRQDVSGFAAH